MVMQQIHKFSKMTSKKLKIIRKLMLSCLICTSIRLVELSQLTINTTSIINNHNLSNVIENKTRRSDSISRPQIVQLTNSTKRMLNDPYIENYTKLNSDKIVQQTKFDLDTLSSFVFPSTSLSPITEPILEPITQPLGVNSAPSRRLSLSSIREDPRALTEPNPPQLKTQTIPFNGNLFHSIPLDGHNWSDTKSNNFQDQQTIINDVKPRDWLNLSGQSNKPNKWSPLGQINWGNNLKTQQNAINTLTGTWDVGQGSSLQKTTNLDPSEMDRYIYLNQMSPSFHPLLGQHNGPKVKLRDLLPSANWQAPAIMDQDRALWQFHSHGFDANSKPFFQMYGQDRPYIMSNFEQPDIFGTDTVTENSIDNSNLDFSKTHTQGTTQTDQPDVDINQLGNAFQAISNKVANSNSVSAPQGNLIDDKELISYLSSILKNEIISQEKQKINNSAQVNQTVQSYNPQAHQQTQTQQSGQNSTKFNHGMMQPQMNIVNDHDQQSPGQTQNTTIPLRPELIPIQPGRFPYPHASNYHSLALNGSDANNHMYYQTPDDFQPTTKRSKNKKKKKPNKYPTGRKKNNRKSSRPIIQVNRSPYLADSSRLHEINSPHDLQSSSTFHKFKPGYYDDDEEEGETEVNIRFFNNFSRMGPFAGVARTGGAVALVVSLAFLILSNVSLATTLIAHGIYNYLRNTSDEPIGHRNRFFRPFDVFRRNMANNSTNNQIPIRIQKQTTTEAPIRTLDQHIESLGDNWR